MKKYTVTMDIEIDEGRNIELAIDSSLCEYGINVVEIIRITPID